MGATYGAVAALSIVGGSLALPSIAAASDAKHKAVNEAKLSDLDEGPGASVLLVHSAISVMRERDR